MVSIADLGDKRSVFKQGSKKFSLCDYHRRASW